MSEDKKLLTDEELENANGGIVLNVAEVTIAQTPKKAIDTAISAKVAQSVLPAFRTVLVRGDPTPIKSDVAEMGISTNE